MKPWTGSDARLNKAVLRRLLEPKQITPFGAPRPSQAQREITCRMAATYVLLPMVITDSRAALLEQPGRQAPAMNHHQRKPTAPGHPHRPGQRSILLNPQTHGQVSAARRPPIAISENSVVRAMSIMYVSCVSDLGHPNRGNFP